MLTEHFYHIPSKERAAKLLNKLQQDPHESIDPYISTGKSNFVAESINKLNVHPIIKTKGKVMLKPESISFVDVQVPRDISGNKKYQLNPNAYLPNGIIPLDPKHSFEKTPKNFTTTIFTCLLIMN